MLNDVKESPLFSGREGLTLLFIQALLEKKFEQFRIKDTALHHAHDFYRLAVIKPGPIGAVCCEGVKDVSDRDDTRLKGDIVSLQTRRISASIKPLVMAEDDVYDRRGKSCLACQVGSPPGMVLDQVVFMVCQFACLVEHFF